MPERPPIDLPPDTLQSLLDRPADQRLREYKYRFAQAMVFGLPVIALHLWGSRLGGADAGRWVPLFQLLLAGWVMYVGVAGMLFEGTVLALRGRITADWIAAMLSIGLYLASLASIAGLSDLPPMFHWSVIVVIAWSAVRWGMMGGKSE